jgi:hypothetical protein
MKAAAIARAALLVLAHPGTAAPVLAVCAVLGALDLAGAPVPSAPVPERRTT